MGGQDHHLIIFLYVVQFHASAATKYNFTLPHYSNMSLVKTTQENKDLEDCLGDTPK